MRINIEQIDCPHCGGAVPFEKARLFPDDVALAQAATEAIEAHLGRCAKALAGALEEFRS
jgi:hypothetical protein